MFRNNLYNAFQGILACRDGEQLWRGGAAHLLGWSPIPYPAGPSPLNYLLPRMLGTAVSICSEGTHRDPTQAGSWASQPAQPYSGSWGQWAGFLQEDPWKEEILQEGPPPTISFNTAPQSVHKALRLFCRVEDNPSPSCSLANIIFLLRHKIYSFSKCYSESRWGRLFFF